MGSAWQEHDKLYDSMGEMRLRDDSLQSISSAGFGEDDGSARLGKAGHKSSASLSLAVQWVLDEANMGEQTGDTVWASLNNTPSAASLSIFGECAHPFP